MNFVTSPSALAVASSATPDHRICVGEEQWEGMKKTRIVCTVAHNSCFRPLPGFPSGPWCTQEQWC